MASAARHSERKTKPTSIQTSKAGTSIKNVRPSNTKSSVGVSRAVPAKTGAPKPGSSGAPKKGQIKHHKKPHRVEILDPNHIESAPLPAVQIENETCRVKIDERISRAIGLPGRKSLGIIQHAVEEAQVPLSIGENDLNQPSFQSCQTLMKTLEKLKNLDVDTSSLAAIKVQKDKTTQECLTRKVAATVNVDPTEIIYSHLEPLAMNLEQLALAEERKRQLLAEKCAPKRLPRDPELSLEDVVTPMVVPREPTLPPLAFLDQCHSFQIDPFAQKRIPKTNVSIPAIIWLE